MNLTEKEINMLNLILRNVLITLTMLSLSVFASAQTTYTKIGGITFGSDGSTASTIGGTTFITNSDGSSATAQKVGETTFINSSAGVTSTISKVGNTKFVNSSDGSSSTINKVGNTTFNGWEESQDGQAVSREMFITPLVKAIQELSATVEVLKSEIETLKGG